MATSRIEMVEKELKIFDKIKKERKFNSEFVKDFLKLTADDYRISYEKVSKLYQEMQRNKEQKYIG